MTPRAELPRFSVLMASYNNAPYIEAAVRSVVEQRLAAWELLICDDGSSDATLQVLEPWLADPRIRLLRHARNRGYVAALRTMISAARADVVGILDSDDALRQDALEAMLAPFEADPEVSCAYSQLVYCDADLRPRRPGYARPVPEGSSHLHENCASAFRVFRRSAYERTGGLEPDLDYAEDKDLVYKLEEVGRLAFVDRPLYLYRVLPDSQAHGPRRVLGLLRFAEARWRAWERRRGTATPNLSREQIANTMFTAAWFALRRGRWSSARTFAARALRLRWWTPGYLRALLLGKDFISRTWPPPGPAA